MCECLLQIVIKIFICMTVGSLTQRVEDLEDEIKTLRRKHSNNVKVKLIWNLISALYTQFVISI